MSAGQLTLELSAGLDLVDIFRNAHKELKPRTPLPIIRAEFFPFAGLNHTARLNDGELRVRISDIFIDAPADVMGSLASILIGKLYRKAIDHSLHRCYRSYTLKNDIQERARNARMARGRGLRHVNARGRHVDLEASYARVAGRYFDAGLRRPGLSWSKKRSRYILGRYDAAHHMIFVSRVFDAPGVPEFVIDYVMFHELLHVKHQSCVKGARCVVHTAEFRNEERQFSHYKMAKDWLKTL